MLSIPESKADVPQLWGRRVLILAMIVLLTAGFVFGVWIHWMRDAGELTASEREEIAMLIRQVDEGPILRMERTTGSFVRVPVQQAAGSPRVLWAKHGWFGWQRAENHLEID